jgi:hypothetical protein
VPGTNTLAYNEQFKITAEKSFITLGPGVNAIKLFEKLFSSSLKNWANKLVR